jgi:hypothetical protein
MIFTLLAGKKTGGDFLRLAFKNFKIERLKMGTINYKTSDYITIGYNCNNIDYEEAFYNDFIQDDFEQIEYRLKQEYFYYFHITVECGYYEGFYLDIENNFPLCFDDYSEKQAAQKEITQIKKFLIECVQDFGCCAVYPGWCTGYADKKRTLEELSAAIKEMRQEVNNTPTYYTFTKKAG